MKPIFIIRTPSHVPNSHIKHVWEMMHQQIGNDYHPLIVLDNSIKEWTFQLYSAQNTTEIEIEELKKIVLQNINEL